ncbi:MAG: hypothetical protein ACK4NY_12860 [Spirosomataceae bacterium]
MNKTTTLLSIIISSVAHLLCCGLPILMNLMGGSIGILMAIQPYTPILTLIQGGILGWSFHRIYGVKCQEYKVNQWDKLILWVLAISTIGVMVVTHTDLLKSEEDLMKQRQIELFFKNHQSK